MPKNQKYKFLYLNILFKIEYFFKSNIFTAIQILYMYDKIVHWTQQYPWK